MNIYLFSRKFKILVPHNYLIVPFLRFSCQKVNKPIAGSVVRIIVQNFLAHFIISGSCSAKLKPSHPNIKWNRTNTINS